MASRSGEKAPAFDGRGAPFLDYENQAHLWMRTARTEVPARASLLLLRRQPAPRQVCLAESSDFLDSSDGVSKILDILRNYFAPEAVDAIHQRVMRFMRFRRTDQSIDEYIAKFDLLSRKAESKMEMGAGSPEQFVSILRMGDAALSRHEKTLVMASCRKSLRFKDASANMRRLLGSRGSESRQDALLSEEAAEPHASDEDMDILAAHRKAKKTRGDGEKEGGYPEGVGTKRRGADKR